MKTFLELKKNLKKNKEGLKQVRVAILADSSSQFLAQAIEGYGIESGLHFSVFEADYDQIDLQVNDPESDLYQSKSDYILIFHSVYKLHKSFLKMPLEQRSGFADIFMADLKNSFNAINRNQETRIIYLNFPLYDDAAFGHFGNSVTFSWTYQLRKINFELMNLASSMGNLSIADVSLLSNQLGTNAVFDSRMYIHADVIYALDFLPLVAKAVTDIILAQQGKFKKCLILDLDNTVWGGIIGDDGIENIQVGDLGIGKAFTELQSWAKQLKERGIILAVCSKNTESIAKEPFEKHPDMVLRLDDIAVFVANWENKADNIRYIQSVLNIGFDSMVFVDDNPFERGMVKTYLPKIAIPDLPEDPAEYMPYLRSLNLFETASFSKEDAQRTKQYQEESLRMSLKNSFASEEEYLSNLEMAAEIKKFDKFTIPRVAQLSQRSNQFNLRTVRYVEEDLHRISASSEYESFSISLKDKYGDYGLIAVVILKKLNADELFIDNWLMSCRVLKRGVENITLNRIVELGKKAGMKKVIGAYIPTPKNGMVKEHYPNLGFSVAGENTWALEIDSFEQRQNCITTQSN